MYNRAEVKSMKLKPIKVKGELKVRATAEAQAKAQDDLKIEDPSDLEAKIIIDKAVAKRLDDEKSEQETSKKCRASNSANSESKKA